MVTIDRANEEDAEAVASSTTPSPKACTRCRSAVLAENSTMLRMCAELGFSVEEELRQQLRRVDGG